MPANFYSDAHGNTLGIDRILAEIELRGSGLFYYRDVEIVPDPVATLIASQRVSLPVMGGK